MSDYQPGDIVKVGYTIKITDVIGDSVYGRDVQSNQMIWVPQGGTSRVEMVRRSPRPKPEAGAVILGRDVKRIQWKRGTIIRCVLSASGAAVGGSGLVLREDGLWHTLDNERSRWEPDYEFEEIADEARFELRFIA